MEQNVGSLVAVLVEAPAREKGGEAKPRCRAGPLVAVLVEAPARERLREAEPRCRAGPLVAVLDEAPAQERGSEAWPRCVSLRTTQPRIKPGVRGQFALRFLMSRGRSFGYPAHVSDGGARPRSQGDFCQHTCRVAWQELLETIQTHM